MYEPKRRVIHAPAFRDTVVQHAVYRVVYDIFDRSFIDTSFACRFGYGTHRAAAYVREAMRHCRGDEYCLQMDVRKFFYSIDRQILRGLVERKIKDVRMVDTMLQFAQLDAPAGIPIGNLLSQLHALIYLNPLDHYVKRELKIRHYVRYVDDFLAIGLSRPAALEARGQITEFLRERLHLEISKATIQQVRRGVNFCGYRTWRSVTVIRKRSLYKFRRAVQAGRQESAASLLGHAERTNSLPYMLNLMKEGIRNGKTLQIPKGYRRLYHALPARA